MADQLSIANSTRRYWSYGGDPTLLLGGSVEDNLFQIENPESELDLLVEAGGNYVRCTMSMRDEGNVQPFARIDGEYDLDEWNDAYWDRFERFLAATAERDIIVQIELWDCWDCMGGPWAKNAWNPANNVTYTAAESGLPIEPPTAQNRFENSFFSTPPALDDNETVRRYQEAFVDRVLDATLDHGHVLYAVENETEADPAWGEYWAEYVKDRDQEVFITEMWNNWDLSHPDHRNTIDHPEIYDFVEVSQNNFQDGQKHWSALQNCRARVTEPVRPLNNVKIYGSDEAQSEDDIFVGTRDGLERFWRNVIGGCATARFHRPPYGLGISELAQTAIEGARTVTDELDLVACEPHNELLEGSHNRDTEDRTKPDHLAYVLANPGEEYAVYFPGGGAARLEPDVSEMTCRWYDADEAEWGPEEDAKDGYLDTPDEGQWIAVVQ